MASREFVLLLLSNLAPAPMRLGRMTSLQGVIGNARAQMMDVVKADSAREPLQNLRQLIKRTCLAAPPSRNPMHSNVRFIHRTDSCSRRFLLPEGRRWPLGCGPAPLSNPATADPATP